jgi:hypothetical protein
MMAGLEDEEAALPVGWDDDNLDRYGYYCSLFRNHVEKAVAGLSFSVSAFPAFVLSPFVA